MANKDAAFGLKPIGKVGQNRDNAGLSEYDIAASADAIYFNDPVEMGSGGTITVAAATDVLLGSLNGVFFTDASSSKPTYANHLDASNTATDIVGFVSDDPYERFEIQSAGTPAQTNIGNCADVVAGSGSTTTGQSGFEISGTMAAGTATCKILALHDAPDNDFGANAVMEVLINEHLLKDSAGI